MAQKRKAGTRALKTGEYYNKKTGRFQYRTMRDGERYTITAATLDDLREKKEQLLDDLKHGRYETDRDPHMTLDSYFDFWIENIAKSGSKKPTTIQNYKSYYEGNVRGKLGKKQLSKVTKVDCQMLFNKMIANGRKRSTMANMKTCLNKVFACAIDDCLIDRNPVMNIELPSDDTKERSDISDSQMMLFLDFVKNDMRFSEQYAYFLLLFNTGARCGEISALTINDFDFASNTISITKSLNRYREKDYGFTVACSTPKSKTSIRSIKVSDSVMHIIRKHMLQYPANGAELPMLNNNGKVTGSVTGFVFRNQSGNPWVEPSLMRLIKSIVKAQNKAVSGIMDAELLEEFTLHQTRHTFTSICYQNGADMKEVAETLGHKSIKTTMDTYTHLREAETKNRKALVSIV